MFKNSSVPSSYRHKGKSADHRNKLPVPSGTVVLALGLMLSFWGGCIGSYLQHVGSLIFTASWGMLHCAHRSSSCGIWALEYRGSVLAVRGLSCFCSMWYLSSLTKSLTHIPCIGRWILKHWAPEEVHHVVLLPLSECVSPLPFSSLFRIIPSSFMFCATSAFSDLFPDCIFWELQIFSHGTKCLLFSAELVS